MTTHLRCVRLFLAHEASERSSLAFHWQGKFYHAVETRIMVAAILHNLSWTKQNDEKIAERDVKFYIRRHPEQTIIPRCKWFG